jgi:hypothetical protein
MEYVNKNGIYSGQIVTVASDHTSHEIVVATEILGGTIVDDVGTMLQRPLEIRTHHSIVYHDDRIRGALFYVRTDLGQVGNLKQWICGALKEHHGSLASDDVLMQVTGIGCINMVDGDTAMGLDVFQQTVGAAVEIISSDDFVSWFEKTEDNI